jgi:hypothetical protein
VKRLASLLFSVAAVAALPASASAGVLVPSAGSCDAQTLSQPFARFLDPAQYTLVPGGAFESAGPGWQLSGGASVAGGNESYRVHGAGDTQALHLPAGASAVSPAMCVGIGNPTLRLFARRTSGGLLSLSTLRVDVLFRDNLGLLSSLPIGLVAGGSSWSPTLPMLVVANLLPLLPGEETPVAFRLTAQGASWEADDVYVDPWSSR